MTHPELIEHAAAWLRKSHPVVITEMATTGEDPDAIGWRNGFSTLVECKASRADFVADAHKPFRVNPESGIGAYRYYLAPAGVIAVDELPGGWGLLSCDGQRTRQIRAGEQFTELNHRHEIGILLSALRRIGHTAPPGVSIRCYTIESKNRTTLGVEPVE